MSNGLPGLRNRAERRQRKRILLSSPLVARVGSFGAVLIDISDGGARVEHYTRMKTGQETTVRFEWDGHRIELPCRVMSCRVVRFASGDDGLTVYQSGLAFVEPEGESAVLLRNITTTFVARALAEQVANAKGVKPLDTDNMPIFRGGVLSSNAFESADAQRNKHLIPIKKIVTQRGFLCCRLTKTGWTKKWTMDPTQPEQGFTVSVHEPAEQVALLCETYQKGNASERELIRSMAALSVDSTGEN